MSRVPRISVCIPVYNGEPYIGQAIRSVLAQSFQDYELIILDNCSTDTTLATAAQFTDSRIRILPNATNEGAEANWNRALAAARAPFVKVLCADDTIDPDCLSEQLSVLESDEESRIALVCSARRIIDESGRSILVRRAARHDLRLTGKQAIRRTIRAGTNTYGETSSALFRASAAAAAGPFSTSIPYVVDLDMWSRLLLYGDLYYQARALSAYRISTGAWSMELFSKQGIQFRQLAEKLRRNPVYGLSAWDIALCRVNVARQVFLRRLFYRFFLPRTGRAG